MSKGSMAEKEKKRQLTEAEQKRLDKFERISSELVEKGYRKSDLQISIVWANVVVILMTIPVMAVGIILMNIFHPDISFKQNLSGTLFVMIGFLVLIVVHELIHGFTWSFFSENGLKDIEFGFMKQYLTPYCTCSTPLKKSGYICGALMPLLVLGLIPTVIAVVIGSVSLLYVGLLMILSAGGDILIVIKLLRYKSQAKELLIYDHPTQAGSVVFEK